MRKTIKKNDLFPLKRSILLNPIWASFLILIFGTSDVLGFSVTVQDISELTPAQSWVFIIGLAAAFEIAPIYIGYAICQKCYNIGTQGLDDNPKKHFQHISTFVLVFSSIACGLGIAANIFARIMILINSDNIKENLAIAVVMCVVPVITSFVNLSAGCLSFDPLIMDIFNLSVKLAKQRTLKAQIQAKVNQLLKYDSVEYDTIKNKKIAKMYNEVDKLNHRLNMFIEAIIDNEDEMSNIEN